MIATIKEILTVIRNQDVSSSNAHDNIRFAFVALNSVFVTLILFVFILRDIICFNPLGLSMDIVSIALFVGYVALIWKMKKDFLIYIMIAIIGTFFAWMFIINSDSNTYLWSLVFPIYVFLALNNNKRIAICTGYLLILVFSQILVRFFGVQDIAEYDTLLFIRLVIAYITISFIFTAVSWVNKLTGEQIEKYHNEQGVRVKELEIARYELRSLTNIDPLTQLYNKRYLYSAENKFFDEIEGGYTSAFFIDIDDFKKYNDYYGHVAGDNVLKEISAVIKECFKKHKNFLMRFGGEEIVCFAIVESLKDSEYLAEEILDKLRQKNLEHKPSSLGYVSVSIGIASSSSNDTQDISRLIKYSDDAMYDAKKIKNTWSVAKTNDKYSNI